MRIKSRGFSILYKLALVVLGCTGLQMALHLFTDVPNYDALKFFTNLSNALTVIYFLIAALRLMFNPNSSPTFWPLMKGVVTMGLTVTGLVAHFMLGGSHTVSLVLLHVVVPIMTVLDWLLLDEKGLMHKFSPFIWTVFPILYLAFVFIAAKFGMNMGAFGGYPYPFLDVGSLGVITVLKTISILFVGFVALGYVYVLLDWVLSKFEIRKRTARR